MSWWRRLAGRQAGPAPAVATSTHIPDFIQFLACKRGIDALEAGRLVADSQGLFHGGWAGQEYRDFTERALEALRPLHDETSEAELIRTYQAHAPLDFLRMLSYPLPSQAQVQPIVDRLAGRATVRIVDYGCGLAQRTITVARDLLARGVSVDLALIDIEREGHVEFLAFVCAKYQVPFEFVPVRSSQLHPSLPPHDYCDMVNVLEHLADPGSVVASVDAALSAGGVFLASVEDQADEMMHISANLAGVRAQLSELGYAVAGPCCGASLFVKPAGRSR